MLADLGDYQHSSWEATNNLLRVRQISIPLLYEVLE